MHSINKQTAV